MTRFLFLCLSLAALGSLAAAQDGGRAKDQDPALPALEEIQSQLEALGTPVEGQADPQGARRAPLRRIREALIAEAGFAAKAAEFERKASKVQGEVEALTALLASPPEDPVVPVGSTVAEVEAAAEGAAASAEAARAQVAEFEQESLRRKARIPAIREELAQVAQQVGQLTPRLAEQPQGEGDAELAQLQRWARKAELAAAKAHLAALEMERDLLEESKELLPLRKDEAVREAARSGERADALRRRAIELQRSEAERELERAAERLRNYAQTLEPLQPLAAELQELAAEEGGPEGTLQRTQVVEEELVTVSSDIAELKRRFTTTRQRVVLVGRSRGMGAILRREFEALPTLSDGTMSLREVRTELSDVQLLGIDFSDRRDTAGEALLADLEALRAELSAQIEADPQLDATVRGMLQERRKRLTDLEAAAETLVVRLGDLRDGLVERTRWVDAYRAYIRERILWVRSMTGGLLPGAEDLRRGSAWFGDPAPWRATLSEITSSPGGARLRWFGVVLGCLLVWATGRTARANVEDAAEATRSYKTDSFRHTLQALVATVLLATRFPSILLVAGLALHWFAPEMGAPRPVGAGLLAAAVVLYVLRLARAMSLPKGLGQAHFRWPQRTAAFVHKQIRLFSLPFAVCVAVVVTLDRSEPVTADTVGRWVFCLAMGLLAVVSHRILDPIGPVISEYKKRRPGWVFRSAAPAVHRIAVALPIALALGALLGYYYTALRLAERYALSLAFGVVLVLLYGLLLRWLFLARRNLAIEQARVRAEAKTEAALAQGNEDYVPTPIDEEALDLPAVNAQTQQLFRFSITCTALVALLLIWSSTLPALKIFERVQIWPTFELMKEGESNDLTLELMAEAPAPELEPGAAEPEGQGGASGFLLARPGLPVPGEADAAVVGDEGVGAGEQALRRVTLADLGIAILIFVLTLGAARNLPSLVEIVLLQRLDLDGGSRHAISTLVRYVILILGSMLGFGAVGISWSSIQWLAAALTFGLAFGLQEIFANFVSGLIILIERPVRVGDIVTVAGTEGQVTRLRMRATTILDYNRRELLVPNREFITGSLVNWTLSDPLTREIIQVGVAYGSDIDLTRKLLLQAAKDSALVVDDPPAQAIFRAFGASSLDFELRVFMPNREIWARVIDDVHRRIDALFREHEIEISFPQQDLHVRSLGPLADVLRPAQEEGPDPTQAPGDDPLSGAEG